MVSISLRISLKIRARLPAGRVNTVCQKILRDSDTMPQVTARESQRLLMVWNARKMDASAASLPGWLENGSVSSCACCSSSLDSTRSCVQYSRIHKNRHPFPPPRTSANRRRTVLKRPTPEHDTASQFSGMFQAAAAPRPGGTLAIIATTYCSGGAGYGSCMQSV